MFKYRLTPDQVFKIMLADYQNSEEIVSEFAEEFDAHCCRLLDGASVETPGVAAVPRTYDAFVPHTHTEKPVVELDVTVPVMEQVPEPEEKDTKNIKDRAFAAAANFKLVNKLVTEGAHDEMDFLEDLGWNVLSNSRLYHSGTETECVCEEEALVYTLRNIDKFI